MVAPNMQLTALTRNWASPSAFHRGPLPVRGGQREALPYCTGAHSLEHSQASFHLRLLHLLDAATCRLDDIHIPTAELMVKLKELMEAPIRTKSESQRTRAGTRQF
jgi:hypothetical protein